MSEVEEERMRREQLEEAKQMNGCGGNFEILYRGWLGIAVYD